jgi:hypothetical protein
MNTDSKCRQRAERLPAKPSGSQESIREPRRGIEATIGISVPAGTSAKGLFKYAGGTATFTNQNPKAVGYDDTTFDIVNSNNMAFSELNVNGNGQECQDILVCNWMATVNGTQFWGMFTYHKDYSETMEYIVERDISSSLGTLDFNDTMTTTADFRYQINDGS